MTTLHHEIHIQAPPQRVWEVLADLEAVQHYSSEVASARYLTERRTGVGAARHCSFKPKGFAKERVTAWEPETAMEIEMYESSFPLRFMRWRQVLRPEAGGTRLVQDLHYRVKFGPVGMLLDALMVKRTFDRAMVDAFQGLRLYAESGSAQKAAPSAPRAAAPGRS